MSKERRFIRTTRDNDIADYKHPRGEPVKTNTVLLRAWVGGNYDFPFKPHVTYNKLPRTHLKPDAERLTFDGTVIAEHKPDGSVILRTNTDNAVYHIHRQLTALLIEADYEEDTSIHLPPELPDTDTPVSRTEELAEETTENLLDEIFG